MSLNLGLRGGEINKDGKRGSYWISQQKRGSTQEFSLKEKPKIYRCGYPSRTRVGLHMCEERYSYMQDFCPRRKACRAYERATLAHNKSAHACAHTSTGFTREQANVQVDSIACTWSSCMQEAFVCTKHTTFAGVCAIRMRTTCSHTF